MLPVDPDRTLEAKKTWLSTVKLYLEALCLTAVYGHDTFMFALRKSFISDYYIFNRRYYVNQAYILCDFNVIDEVPFISFSNCHDSDDSNKVNGNRNLW